MITVNIKTEIIVDRTPITDPNQIMWPEESRNKYGQFAILSENPIAAKVTKFDLDKDITFASCVLAQELISGEEKVRRLEAYGLVPLDIYCLRAILQQKNWKDYIRFLQEKQYGGLGSPCVEAFDFPGTILSDHTGTRMPHFFQIDFDWNTTAFHTLEEICPVELRDQAWGRGRQAVVFTKEFIQKLIH